MDDATRQRLMVLAIAISALACGVSTWLTIRWCVMMRGDGYAVVPVCLGIIWEASKYTFFVYGLRAMRDRPPLGLIYLLTTGVLIAGSIAASMGYLSEKIGEVAQEKLSRSTLYMAVDNEIMSISDEIAIEIATAKVDSNHNYRSRAIGTMKRVRGLRQERRELFARLASMEASPTSAVLSQAVFVGVGAMDRLGMDDAQRASEGVIALVLELCAILALVMSWDTNTASATRQQAAPRPDARTRTGPLKTSTPTHGSASTGMATGSGFSDILEYREFGGSLSYDAMRTAFGSPGKRVGQKKIEAMLCGAQRAGIVRQGPDKRYEWVKVSTKSA